MGFASLVLFILLGFGTAYASPFVQIRDSVITLPIAAHINASGGTAALIKADRARFEMLRAKSVPHAKGVRSLNAPKTDPINVTDASVIYTSNIEIGSPPTTYSLLVDTGSSNTWIGADKPYSVTSTSRRTADNVSVSYGSGHFDGIEYTDTVTIGSAVIKLQSIGVAFQHRGFQNVDGILGIGPAGLTLGTLIPHGSSQVATVTTNLKSQGFISAAQIGISFKPSQVASSLNGELLFGGSDKSKFTGSINFVPITSKFPASAYWGIDQGITYGPSSILILPPSSAGIVDTGTTLLYLPTDAYMRYVSATGGKIDSTTGLLKITSANFSKLKSLFFTIGGAKYEFTANAQIWPRSLNVVIGGSADAIYLVVANNGMESGSGLDFVNGLVWLRRFYTVLDTDNKRVGFATTSFTNATTN